MKDSQKTYVIYWVHTRMPFMDKADIAAELELMLLERGELSELLLRWRLMDVFRSKAWQHSSDGKFEHCSWEAMEDIAPVIPCWENEVVERMDCTKLLNMTRINTKTTESRYLEGRTCAEIAKSENVDPSAISHRIRKALKTIKALSGQSNYYEENGREDG